MPFPLHDWPGHWRIIIAIWYIAPVLLFRLDPVGPNRFGQPETATSFTDYFSGFNAFSGRAGRDGFWKQFQIASLIVSIAIALTHQWPDMALLTGGIITIIIAPLPAAIARRLHDTNLSGWWQLTGLIPPTGTLWLLLRLWKKGD